MGMPEAAVRTQIGRLIEGTPMVLFQFVEVPTGLPLDARERALRADTAFAGAAASNLTLTARCIGLGVAAIGMPPVLAAEADIRQILQVPDAYALVGIYGLGYPAVNGTPAVVKPGSDLLFLERWDAGEVAAPR
jgi:nitroreductase